MRQLLRAERSLLLAVLVLGACSESSPLACATQVAAEVCSSPGNLRGAEPVPPSTAQDALVSLPPTPLAEGRYVLVSRRFSCPTGSEPAAGSVSGVLEVTGCVLRRTLVAEPEQPAQVEVFALSGSAEGVLELERRCGEDAPGPLPVGYGFDGTLLELSPLPSAEGASSAAECAELDTWELR